MKELPVKCPCCGEVTQTGRNDVYDCVMTRTMDVRCGKCSQNLRWAICETLFNITFQEED